MSFNKYHDYQFFDKKNKEKKKNIMLNFPVRCMGYRLVSILQQKTLPNVCHLACMTMISA